MERVSPHGVVVTFVVRVAVLLVVASAGTLVAAQVPSAGDEFHSSSGATVAPATDRERAKGQGDTDGRDEFRTRRGPASICSIRPSRTTPVTGNSSAADLIARFLNFP